MNRHECRTMLRYISAGPHHRTRLTMYIPLAMKYFFSATLLPLYHDFLSQNLKREWRVEEDNRTSNHQTCDMFRKKLIQHTFSQEMFLNMARSSRLRKRKRRTKNGAHEGIRTAKALNIRKHDFRVDGSTWVVRPSKKISPQHQLSRHSDTQSTYGLCAPLHLSRT